jgi:hypothetical protein
MNCQEFSDHATEIARAQVMDAAARDAALGHAQECDACAARLERERALSAALRATAESFDGSAAPARVEAALLAAFRAERDAARQPVTTQPFAPAAAPAPVHTFAPRFGRRARVAFAASAIAATLILTFAVATRAPRQDEPSRQIAAGQPLTIPAQSSAVPSVTNETSAQSSPSQPERPASSDAGEEAVRRLNNIEGRKPVRVQRAAGGPSVKKSLTGAALAFNIDGGQAVFAEGDSAGASDAGLRGDAAALTDFVPISAGANSAPLDGGQVVRVEAPRAALASLGLPVDARRANENVKADLLLAHDGTAHAIRFVR